MVARTLAASLAGALLLSACLGTEVVPPAAKTPQSFCNGTLSTRPLAKSSSCYRPGLVSAMQEILNAYGFDAGPVDGVFGGRTLRAYGAFLETQDRVPDAYLTPRTIRYMKSVAGDYPRLSPKARVPERPRPADTAPPPDDGSKTHWALAARTNSVGHAVSFGSSRESAMRRAEAACEAKRSQGPSGPVFGCRALGAFDFDTEGCMAVVNGFVPATRFTAHFGRSITPDDTPRASAETQAFEGCRSAWGTYGRTACRTRNGGASNGVRTLVSYCTSDVAPPRVR